MKNETYLMINGQKIELTAEQKKQLGIVEEKSCFDRVKDKERYYSIFGDGQVSVCVEIQSYMDNERYSIANYCTDKDIMYQRAMHETLNRLLWRYSMTHDGDKIDWNNGDNKYSIIYDNNLKRFVVINWRYFKPLDVCFNSRIIAEAAIEEIVKPFMKEYPDFVW